MDFSFSVLGYEIITSEQRSKMPDDDDRNRRKVQSDREIKPPHWRETCIGVWSKSASKGHSVNEGECDKICHGISLVRIYGKVKCVLHNK